VKHGAGGLLPQQANSTADGLRSHKRPPLTNTIIAHVSTSQKYVSEGSVSRTARPDFL